MADWNEHIVLLPHDRIFGRLIEPLIPKWVRPNHITMARFVLAPIVVAVLAAENYRVGVPLFIFAALTDAFDGSLARLRKQITEWGIRYDPLADKVLIGSVLAVIVLQHVNPYLGYALLAVETALIAGGIVSKRRGKIEPANFWGKIKMVSEVFGIGFLLLALWLKVSLLVDISSGTLALALIIAIVSIFTRIK